MYLISDQCIDICFWSRLQFQSLLQTGEIWLTPHKIYWLNMSTLQSLKSLILRLFAGDWGQFFFQVVNWHIFKYKCEVRNSKYTSIYAVTLACTLGVHSNQNGKSNQVKLPIHSYSTNLSNCFVSTVNFIWFLKSF